MHYTYILISLKDNNFYIGFTDNLKRRFGDHKLGNVNATKNRLPIKLVYYESCLNKYDAIHREKYLKSGSGKRYLRNRLKCFLKENL
ncbi:MAG: GIY-YIG nuclease family protein [Parcubacteria group bacterium]|nr:GIY-YIG nuclease family protein [Parcubacteria group bacterium]